MVFPETGFLTATPESQGVDPHAICKALEDIRASGKDIHSMLILRNGYLIHETYFAPYTADTPHSMYSCSKTFTSMLIGIAQGKGLLSVDDRIVSFFPDKLPESPSENLLAMRIRDLLAMAGGQDRDTWLALQETSGDWVETYLSCPVEHTPGTHFCYNTGSTYMLSAILTKVTGKTALELAEEWIFSRIGMGTAVWDSSPQGISLGGTGLHLTPRQMARFGLLLLNDGQWNGEEIVPKAYVREAQKAHIPTTNHMDHPSWTAGYCWQMWRCAFEAFRADGMGGQYIVMLPKANAVVVFTSALGGDIPYPMDILRDDLLDALHGEKALPEDPSANEILAQLSAKCGVPKRDRCPAEASAQVPWGRRIELDGLLLGMFPAIALDRNGLMVDTEWEDAVLQFGWNAPVLADFAMPIAGIPVRPSFLATYTDHLTIRINALGEPLTIRLDFRFEGDECTVTQSATLFLPSEEFHGKLV